MPPPVGCRPGNGKSVWYQSHAMMCVKIDARRRISPPSPHCRWNTEQMRSHLSLYSRTEEEQTKHADGPRPRFISPFFFFSPGRSQGNFPTLSVTTKPKPSLSLVDVGISSLSLSSDDQRTHIGRRRRLRSLNLPNAERKPLSLALAAATFFVRLPEGGMEDDRFQRKGVIGWSRHCKAWPPRERHHNDSLFAPASLRPRQESPPLRILGKKAIDRLLER